MKIVAVTVKRDSWSPESLLGLRSSALLKISDDGGYGPILQSGQKTWSQSQVGHVVLMPQAFPGVGEGETEAWTHTASTAQTLWPPPALLMCGCSKLKTPLWVQMMNKVLYSTACGVSSRA